MKDHCEKDCVHVLYFYKFVIDYRLKDTNITHQYNFLLTASCSFYFTITKLHIPGLNILIFFIHLFFLELYNTNIFQNLDVFFYLFVQNPGYRATTTLLKAQHKTTRDIHFFSISGIVLQSTFWQSHIYELLLMLSFHTIKLN